MKYHLIMRFTMSAVLISLATTFSTVSVRADNADDNERLKNLSCAIEKRLEAEKYWKRRKMGIQTIKTMFRDSGISASVSHMHKKLHESKSFDDAKSAYLIFSHFSALSEQTTKAATNHYSKHGGHLNTYNPFRESSIKASKLTRKKVLHILYQNDIYSTEPSPADNLFTKVCQTPKFNQYDEDYSFRDEDSAASVASLGYCRLKKYPEFKMQVNQYGGELQVRFYFKKAKTRSKKHTPNLKDLWDVGSYTLKLNLITGERKESFFGPEDSYRASTAESFYSNYILEACDLKSYQLEAYPITKMSLTEMKTMSKSFNKSFNRSKNKSKSIK